LTIEPRRPVCAACLRAQRACICRWAVPLDHPVEVLILQHPLEVDNAKGSARLLHLSLPNSRLLTGEHFDEAQLRALLSPERRSLLLYPDTPTGGVPELPSPPAFDAAWTAQPERLRLVVLDGTWRKSRKMLYLNPLLQTLPRLPLRDTPPSHYLIRKAHLPDQLSTLEATCYALAQLDGSVDMAPLMAAFDGFVAQRRAFVPGSASDE
jgi:DTW domain-containing protein YfiP